MRTTEHNDVSEGPDRAGGGAEPSPGGGSPPVTRDDDGSPGATGPEAEARTDASPERTGRQIVLGWLPWILAVAALAAAAYSTVQWRTLAAQEAAREDVASAAASFARTLTTWDATEGLGELRDTLRDAGTGEFVEEVDNLFGGTLGADLEAAGAASEGSVSDVFVQALDGDAAEVFVVVDQTIRSELSEQPEQTVRSARITMQRVEGEWKVSGVDLINDDVQSPVGPPGGDGASEETP